MVANGEMPARYLQDLPVILLINPVVREWVPLALRDPMAGFVPTPPPDMSPSPREINCIVS